MIRYISLETAKREFPHLKDKIASGGFIIHVPERGGKDAAYICTMGDRCYYFSFKEDPATPYSLHEDLYIIAECLVWKTIL